MEVKLGRVVGSKIRNSNEMPTDFKGWLEGDIFILNDNIERYPYYEYTNGELLLRGYLRGTTPEIKAGTTTFNEQENVSFDVVLNEAKDATLNFTFPVRTMGTYDKILNFTESLKQDAKIYALSARQGYVLDKKISDESKNINYKIESDALIPKYSINTYINSNNDLEKSLTLPIEVHYSLWNYVSGSPVSVLKNKKTDSGLYLEQIDSSYLPNNTYFFMICDENGKICLARYGTNWVNKQSDDYDRHPDYYTNNPAWGSSDDEWQIPPSGFAVVFHSQYYSSEAGQNISTQAYIDEIIRFFVGSNIEINATSLNKYGVFADKINLNLNIEKNSLDIVYSLKKYKHYLKIYFEESLSDGSTNKFELSGMVESFKKTKLTIKELISLFPYVSGDTYGYSVNFQGFVKKYNVNGSCTGIKTISQVRIGTTTLKNYFNVTCSYDNGSTDSSGSKFTYYKAQFYADSDIISQNTSITNLEKYIQVAIV